jgi:hypothetical protein
MKQCAEQTGCAAPFISHEAATLPAAEAWNRPVMALAIGAGRVRLLRALIFSSRFRLMRSLRKPAGVNRRTFVVCPAR